MREKATQFGFFVIDRGFSTILCFEATARDMEVKEDRKPVKNSCERMAKCIHQEKLQD
jgi:hypothetical protein